MRSCVFKRLRSRETLSLGTADKTMIMLRHPRGTNADNNHHLELRKTSWTVQGRKHYYSRITAVRLPRYTRTTCNHLRYNVPSAVGLLISCSWHTVCSECSGTFWRLNRVSNKFRISVGPRIRNRDFFFQFFAIMVPGKIRDFLFIYFFFYKNVFSFVNTVQRRRFTRIIIIRSPNLSLSITRCVRTRPGRITRAKRPVAHIHYNWRRPWNGYYYHYFFLISKPKQN